jgi:hypothetical protein
MAGVGTAELTAEAIMRPPRLGIELSREKPGATGKAGTQHKSA